MRFAAFCLSICGFTLVTFLTGCGKDVVTGTEAEPVLNQPSKAEITALPMWLGSLSRTFYGTGPWSPGSLQVVWEFETKLTRGRFHKDLWGGSSWPGQPSIDGERVYFGSADGHLYCLDRANGGLIWSFKTEDSLKASPTIAGDRLIASGLDHYVYCLNAKTVANWKFKTGFE